MYKEPDTFRPERFMPGDEYDQFDEAIRAYMFVPFIQVGGRCSWDHWLASGMNRRSRGAWA